MAHLQHSVIDTAVANAVGLFDFVDAQVGCDDHRQLSPVTCINHVEHLLLSVFAPAFGSQIIQNQQVKLIEAVDIGLFFLDAPQCIEHPRKVGHQAGSAGVYQRIGDAGSSKSLAGSHTTIQQQAFALLPELRKVANVVFSSSHYARVRTVISCKVPMLHIAFKETCPAVLFDALLLLFSFTLLFFCRQFFGSAPAEARHHLDHAQEAAAEFFRRMAIAAVQQTIFYIVSSSFRHVGRSLPLCHRHDFK